MGTRRITRRIAAQSGSPVGVDPHMMSEARLLARASSVVDLGTLGESAQVNGPTPTYPVFGTAVTGYPGTGRSTEQEMTAHAADCGTIPCYRSYSSTSAPWPTTWAALGGGCVFGAWQTRWSWHSLKPNPQALASGSEYTNIINFVNSIPVTGYKRLLTFWHEMDVGTKIPDNMSYAEGKLLLYEVGRAIKDAGHPDVLYGPVFGSKFTTGKTTTIMSQTSVTTAALRGVVDFVGWDPYNEASFSGLYNAQYQNVDYYFADLVTWNQTNFPAARMAIGEFGYQPNENDLNARPTWIQAVVDWSIAQNALATCYFDASVSRAAWLRVYETVRGSTASFAPDLPSIDQWSDTYAAYPAFQS